MLVVNNKPKPPISEAYRTHKINMEFSDFDNDINTNLITSFGPQEGKSTTVTNLDLSVAETGKKLILIDCDPRNTPIYVNHSISSNKGISNLLIGKFEFDDVAQIYAENLYILTSGTIPSNPFEMISSKKAKQ